MLLHFFTAHVNLEFIMSLRFKYHLNLPCSREKVVKSLLSYICVSRKLFLKNQSDISHSQFQTKHQTRAMPKHHYHRDTNLSHRDTNLSHRDTNLNHRDTNLSLNLSPPHHHLLQLAVVVDTSLYTITLRQMTMR